MKRRANRSKMQTVLVLAVLFSCFYLIGSGTRLNVELGQAGNAAINANPDYEPGRVAKVPQRIQNVDALAPISAEPAESNEDQNAQAKAAAAAEPPRIRLAAGEFDPLSVAAPMAIPAELALAEYPAGVEGYYLVQFQGQIKKKWKDALLASGAALFDYIPDYTFVAKMDSQTKAKVAAIKQVRWLGILEPAYRIEPDLKALSQLARSSTGKLKAKGPESQPGKIIESAQLSRVDLPESVDIIVVLFNEEDIAGISQQIEALGGTITDVSDGEWKEKLAATIDPAVIIDIANITGVKWIEPAPVWELHNNLAASNAICDVKDVWDNHGLYGQTQTS